MKHSHLPKLDGLKRVWKEDIEVEIAIFFEFLEKNKQVPPLKFTNPIQMCLDWLDWFVFSMSQNTGGSHSKNMCSNRIPQADSLLTVLFTAVIISLVLIDIYTTP